MAHAVKIIYSVRDQKGKIATCTVHLPSNLTIGDYLEFAEEMGDLIDALTVGQIVSVGIAFTVDISGFGWTAAPGSTADVEEKGAFQFTTLGAFHTGVAIPCLSESKVLTGSDGLDLTDSDVDDFVTAMEDGITLPVLTTLVKPSDSREDDVTALVYARERFRASGRRTL